MSSNKFDPKAVSKHWSELREILSPYQSKRAYQRGRKALDALIDHTGENEAHELAGLVHTIAMLIADYEKRTLPPVKNDPLENLRFLIEQHQLTQKDLPEIGSQGVVSEVLSGKRELNKRQIVALSKRFNVSPRLFLPSLADKMEAA